MRKEGIAIIAEMRNKEVKQKDMEKKLQEDRRSSNKTGIPDQLKNGIEAVSGLSFDDVRVHYSSHKPEVLYANAYTQGSHVYIGPGKESSLPHELGHVIQQKQRRVRPTVYLGRMAVNEDRALEREADRLGAMALQWETGCLPKNTIAGSLDIDSPIQMDANAEFGQIVSLQQYQGQQPQERREKMPSRNYKEAHKNARIRLAGGVIKTHQARGLSERVQDKESMVAFFGDSKENVRFISSFSVRKPNKKISVS